MSMKNGNDADIIIIGAGLGGLICANILSREGFRVLVLEKNPVIGGNLQIFKRNGVVFDTGIHYAGSLDFGQNLYKIFNYLGIIDKIRIKKLDVNGFDKILLGDKQYDLPMGFDRFYDKMCTYFPHEKNGIKSYLDLMQKQSKIIDVFNLDPNTSQNAALNFDFLQKNAWEHICLNVKDPDLRQVLASFNSLHAGAPENTFLYIHALISAHFIRSAYRFVNGSAHVADAIKTGIEEHGGEVRVKSAVKKLLFRGKQAVGVELENGEKLFSGKVISNVHPYSTMQMVPDEMVRKSYKSRLMNLRNTISVFTVYVVFKQNAMKYLNSNYYYYKSGNVWAASIYDKVKWPDGYGMFPLAGSMEPKYMKGMSIINYMRYEEVAKWENTKVGRRGDDYRAFKEEKAQQLLDVVGERFPGFKNKVEKYYTSSPLTWRDYTGARHGSMYGIQRDCNHPANATIFPRTKVPNLFLTGQNLNLHGMQGVSFGALMTCSEFIDLNKLIVRINDAL